MRNTIRSLLQLQVLEINTLAVVREDVVRVKRTGRAASLLHVALARHLVTLESGFERDVRDGGAT